MPTHKSFTFKFVFDTRFASNEFVEDLEDASYDKAKDDILEAVREMAKNHFDSGFTIQLIEGTEVYKD